MVKMGISITSVTSMAGLRVPTDRGGVGMVNSDRKTDPDRGFRGLDRNETPSIKISNN